MIHVCFGLYDADGRYSKFTGTTMLSLFENTSANVTVHILHDNTLTQDNREKFIYLAGRYGQVVKFYNVEKLCADKIAEMVLMAPAVKTSRLTVGAMYRLLIPQLLPPELDKCIYLDSDIVVNLNIAELWRVDPIDKPFAAVAEIEIDREIFVTTFTNHYLTANGLVSLNDYLNSGVLLMNLKILRDMEEIIRAGIAFCGKNPQLGYFDQDILNYCFSKEYLKLPVAFNTFVLHSRKILEPPRRKIYHYTYGQRSFGMDMNDPFNRLWMNYFIKTPWFDEDSIGRIYACIQRMYVESVRKRHAESRQALIQLSAIMSGKTRAFVILPQNLETMKQIFGVRDDEEIIFFESEESLPKMIGAMNQGRGKKIFFVLLTDFPIEILTDVGFVYGQDFLNGFEFLAETNRRPLLNSYPLLKSM